MFSESFDPQSERQVRQVSRNCSFKETGIQNMNAPRDFVIILIRSKLQAIFPTWLIEA